MVFKWIWSYIKKFKFRVPFGLFLVIVVAALNMINPYLSGIIVDRVIIGKELNLLALIITIMIANTVTKSLLRYTYQLVYETISQSIILKIRKNLYSRVQELDFEYFDNTRTGDIMTRMTGDIEAVRHFVAWVIYMVFENAIVFVFAITMLFIINFKLAFFMVGIAPIIGFLTYKFAKEVKPSFTAIRNQFSRLNTVVQENISGNRVVKAFTKEDYEIEKFQTENIEFKNKNIESAKIWEKYLPVLDSMAGVLSIIMILAGGIMVINRSLTMGQLVTFSSFIWALTNPMRMAGWLVNDVQRFVASGEKIIVLLNTEPVIKNPENCIQPDCIRGDIEFKNVSFKYNDELVLENLSFSSKPGQIIAVVGATGSGKSTLVSLICRFYDCDSGEIRIDGNVISKIELKTIRKNIAIAMQDIFLFSDTIEGNIAYGVPSATEEQVKWAAELAGADEFIMDFPEGYDTIIGERGVGLSGGQKQRIALARAILKNTPILILDDTTSSVDMETEYRIQRGLSTYFMDKTVFIIAHRISSVKNADLILVLDDGKIIESGRHYDLVKNKGYYYQVYRNQYGDFDNIYSSKIDNPDNSDEQVPEKFDGKK
jgi:ATP-binding cassette, subfamily B, multidrug efflux pump